MFQKHFREEKEFQKILFYFLLLIIKFQNEPLEIRYQKSKLHEFQKIF